jgi:hypothetical protein
MASGALQVKGNRTDRGHVFDGHDQHRRQRHYRCGGQCQID